MEYTIKQYSETKQESCVITRVIYKENNYESLQIPNEEQNLCFKVSASVSSATPGDFSAVINVLQINGLHDPFSHSSKTAMNRSKQSSSSFLMALHVPIVSPSWMATCFHLLGIAATM